LHSHRAANNLRGRRPSTSGHRPLASGVPPRRAESDRGVPDDRRRLGSAAVRAVRGRVGCDASWVPEVGAQTDWHGCTHARASHETRPGRDARRQRCPGGVSDR